MASITARLIRLADGVAVDVVSDSLTGLVTGLVVSNPTAAAVQVRFVVADRVGVTDVGAGLLDVAIAPPGSLLPAPGENISIGAVT